MANAATEFRATVIIPTRNRCDLLRELIESIWAQSVDPCEFEILVVDNNSSDGTVAMLEEMQGKSPCALRFHVSTENKGPIHSRNWGAREARAPILAFTDSDCRVTPGWLALGLAQFDADDGLSFVSGDVLDKPEQPVQFFCLRNGATPGEENFTYPTCNIFFRKETFWKLRGLAEEEYVRDVGDKPIECADTDLAWRMIEGGYKHVYLADLVVYHEVTKLPPMAWLKSHSRVVMVPLAVRLHPQLREKIMWWGPFWTLDSALFYLALIGLAGAIVNPWAALAVLPFVVRAAHVPGRQFTPSRIPKMAARVFFLSLRQAVMNATVLYGSIRCRTLIL